MALPFEQQPRESAKAFAAFRSYLDMGPERSLAAVGEKWGKNGGLMERWSRRWQWAARVQAQGEHLATVAREAAEAVAAADGVDWAERQVEHREDEWKLRADLMAAGRMVLEKIKDGTRGATLGDATRALDLASKLGRLASGLPTEVKAEPVREHTGLLVEIDLALNRVYGPEKPAGSVVDVGEVRGEKVEVRSEKPHLLPAVSEGGKP